MRSYYLAPVLTIGFLLFGVDAVAWSQMRFVGRGMFGKECWTPHQRPTTELCGCDDKTGCDVCQPRRRPLLARFFVRIDCALQRILPCPTCCRESSCDAKPTCGCGTGGTAPPLEVELEPLEDEDPFEDDDLIPPPVPAEEAGYVAGKPVVLRRDQEQATAEAAEDESPKRFQPVNASPLKRLLPIPQLHTGTKTATTTACEKCRAHALASSRRLRR